MSASDHLHPQQLRLFMQADELMDLPAGDSRYFGWSMNDDEGLRDRKIMESQEPRYRESPHKTISLEDSIRQEGVLDPVELEFTSPRGGPMLSNGHHRVAVAHKINPKSWVPVEYDDPW